MIRIIFAVVAILVSSNAMAIQGQAQGQANKNKVKQTVNQNESKRMVKAPNSPSMHLGTNTRWPCGGYAGIGAQGQYAGVNLGGTKDSKNCIAWMLASQTTDLAKKEAYLCQIKVHRNAMKLNGTPCTKLRR